MLERHMEELIAAHPDDFFPRHVLRLCGRQQTFKGVGRFDLHFLDQFDTNILMELKAVPARYEDASQLAKYRDAMQARGDERIIMWLVAPLIPPSVREFLAHIGIEFTEIHESEFKRVAALREVNIDEKPAVKQHLLAPLDLDKASTRPVTRDEKGTSAPGIAWHFNTDESEVPGSTARMIERSCFALWGYKDTERKMNVPTEGEAILFYRSKVGVIAAGFIGKQPAVSSNEVFGKQNEQEFRRDVGELICVDNPKAVTASELRSLGVKGPLLGGLCRRYSSEIATAVREALEERLIAK